MRPRQATLASISSDFSLTLPPPEPHLELQRIVILNPKTAKDERRVRCYYAPPSLIGESAGPESNADTSKGKAKRVEEMETPVSVEYISSQLTPPNGVEPVFRRASPILSLLGDAKHMLSKLRYFPAIFLPFNRQAPLREMNDHRDVVFHVFLFCLTLVMIVVGCVIAFAAPGIISAIWLGLCLLFMKWLCNAFLNYGKQIIESNTDAQPRVGEKWVYVNGVCAGTNWLQENIDLISATFHRPVTGIHNRTWGIILDLLESIIQRSLLYATKDTRATYNYLKQILSDPSVRRVVLIAHSQGGIIVSSVLDALYAEMVPESLGKLEIYTFGCAANHFCNPIHVNSKPAQRQIKTIEHYANEYDFVAQIGVRRFVTGDPQALYIGKVFTRMGRKGHLFNQHYMSELFGRGKKSTFLNTVVKGPAPEKTRDEEAGQIRDSPGEGKTVKELSRLWMYLDGDEPSNNDEHALPTQPRVNVLN